MDVRLTNVYVADAGSSPRLVQPEDAMARVRGPGRQGRVAPFVVRRSYTGAGGWYREAMALLAPNGDVVWRSPGQALTLAGTSKIDTTAPTRSTGWSWTPTTTTSWSCWSAGTRGRPRPPGRAGRGPPWSTGPDTAVLDEALKKCSGLGGGPRRGGTGGRAVPVWYGTLDGRVYVLVGGSEQHVPGLAKQPRVVLIARSKEQQSLVAEVEASARVVHTTSLFARVAPVLLPAAQPARRRAGGRPLAQGAPWSSSPRRRSRRRCGGIRDG